jgi:hypothetical protein
VVEDRSVPRLPSYQSDAAAPSDELARLADAVALAELVTAKSATPPLAVGLFGDWGEGKSHFLELLHEQVAAVARPDNVLAHSAIRQVKFNAWHYAETDLWASLVTELFAQLAVPPDGDAGAEQRRQSRLTADLVTQRGLRERLQAARDRRDDLQKALRKAERGDLGSWEALSEAQREQLTTLIGPSAEKYYRDVIRTASSLQQTGRLSWQLLRTLRLAAVGPARAHRRGDHRRRRRGRPADSQPGPLGGGDFGRGHHGRSGSRGPVAARPGRDGQAGQCRVEGRGADRPGTTAAAADRY